MKIYLFDSQEAHSNLLPLSFTRPVALFRCGILTICEKWEKYLPGDYAFHPVEYLRDKYGSAGPDETALFISGNTLPSRGLADAAELLLPGQCIRKNGEIIAFKGTLSQMEAGDLQEVDHSEEILCLEYIFDIFLKNGNEIKKDFALLTAGRKSRPLPDCVRIFCSDPDAEQPHDIFIEEGAVVECATINTAGGPVYIGSHAVLMEGACIRGPFALCEWGEVRMGTKIYEDTTVGPHCKVGGEISNAVFFGYSNKAHDGYVGNAVIGEWCNIGAGTNASNLKNDYSLIRVWNYNKRSFMRTDLQFCGLIMGDHSKIGVNCMINTATVIGVGVNLHGCGFPRTFIPNFCEGSPIAGFTKVPLKKFLDTAQRVMSRRDLSLTESDSSLLTHIYESAD